MRAVSYSIEIITLIVVCIVLWMAFKPIPHPWIRGYHWGGSTLYSDSGEMAADVVTIPFGNSQSCVFVEPENECSTWENVEQAVRDVQIRMTAIAIQTKVKDGVSK